VIGRQRHNFWGISGVDYHFLYIMISKSILKKSLIRAYDTHSQLINYNSEDFITPKSAGNLQRVFLEKTIRKTNSIRKGFVRTKMW
jgi:hypothetical protein